MSASLDRSVPHVMFLDDDPHFLGSIMSWSTSFSMNREITTDVDEVLRAVRKGDLDLLVSDMRMPGEDGVEVLERARDLDANVSLALLTAFDPSAEQLRRLQTINARIILKTDQVRDLLRELITSLMTIPARKVIELQNRVNALEEMHGEWVVDLVSQLEQVLNYETAAIATTDGPMTIGDLIRDIRELRPRGLRHIRLWLRAKANVRAAKGSR